MKIRKPSTPPILIGADLLAGLSLVWSAYAITDLMHSGPFGLSVAIAGDIGWITVLWAEYRGITIAGKKWAAPAAGWLIAVGVAALLVLHGVDEQSHAQAIAGPFVVLVGKLVWTFALASLRDPAALTPDQLAEIHDVMRQSEYTARLHHAQLDQLDRAADAEIARIRAQARITLARDDTDFEVALERIEKRAEIERRTPIALPPSSPEHTPSTPIAPPNTGPTAPPPASASIADLVRDQVAITPSNTEAVARVLALRPDANRDSVAAAVRRARRQSDMGGGYA
ncbi:hypothetical protein [Streptomyces wuyuanensis]|uniref:hypothetical protein n=1 Tax=Streptomyces wuyuanensis TaxID=1196353 RepID=UPI003788BDFB